VPATYSFDYAVIRIAPRVDREEFINAGVIVICTGQRFLDARIHIDESRLLALWPSLDLALVRQHLEAIPRIVAGDESAGAIARLSQKERFHWLTSPRSTIIQVSPVRTGVTSDPAAVVERLTQQLLLTEHRA
jgi:hypothetical protein